MQSFVAHPGLVSWTWQRLYARSGVLEAALSIAACTGACLQQWRPCLALLTCSPCSMLTPLLCSMQAVTDHFGKSDSEHKLSSKIVETYANSPIGQSAENGAIPLEYASVSADLEGLSFASRATSRYWKHEQADKSTCSCAVGPLLPSSCQQGARAYAEHIIPSVLPPGCPSRMHCSGCRETMDIHWEP